MRSLFICSVCSDLGTPERQNICVFPLGVVNMLRLHILHRKTDIYEAWEEILPLRKWAGVLLLV